MICFLSPLSVWTVLTELALNKLSQMSDEDLEKLELYPDFDA